MLICFSTGYDESSYSSLAVLNDANPYFGLPIPVCSNDERMVDLYLETNVRLPSGNIHIGFENAVGDFALWVWDSDQGGYRLIADTDSGPLDISFAGWRALVGGSSDQYSSQTPIYITSTSSGVATLVYRYWGVFDGKLVEDVVRQTISSIDPVVKADMDRDGDIDDDDGACLSAGSEFRYWYNEDSDKDDYIGASGDTSLNASDDKVNGKFDLVNLFPVEIDVSRFKSAWNGSAELRLRSWSSKLRYCVLPSLGADQVGDIQTGTVSISAEKSLDGATLVPLNGDGVDVDDLLPENRTKVILAFEASGPVDYWSGPELTVMLNGSEVFSCRLPVDISSVRRMYRWMNVREYSGEGVTDASAMHEPYGLPDSECSEKTIVFLHGANVSQGGARAWMDIVFKRLWLSGSRARFVGVTWRSDIGTSANYQQNASNAFEVAAYLAPQLSSAIPGTKVLMAHSLGNMVCSSMIQDHGLQVEKFLMCNSAVPSEAYCGADDESIRVPQLVHPEWTDYPTNTWASNWHKLFREDAGDDRKHLGWPARFADVAAVAVNFYSTGDEVLELNDESDIWPTTGILSGRSHYSWHKQEMFKGRWIVDGLGGTTWAGWNFTEITYIPPLSFIPITERKYTAEASTALTDWQLKTDPVFNLYPHCLTNSVLPLLTCGAVLSQGIPALARPTGGTAFGGDLMLENMIDLDESDEDMKSQGWPSRSSYGTRWLHSDMKDVAYYFNFKFYNKIVEKGSLK